MASEISLPHFLALLAEAGLHWLAEPLAVARSSDLQEVKALLAELGL